MYFEGDLKTTLFSEKAAVNKDITTGRWEYCLYEKVNMYGRKTLEGIFIDGVFQYYLITCNPIFPMEICEIEPIKGRCLDMIIKIYEDIDLSRKNIKIIEEDYSDLPF